MSRKHDGYPLPPETGPLPEEYPPPAAEFTPPPEEFPAPGRQETAAEGEQKRRRWRKRLLYLAAGAVILLLISGRRIAPAPIREERPPAPTVQQAEPAPGERASPAASPSASPSEPTAEPTAEPTPEPEPSCEILFYTFSSTNYVRLNFTRPEAFRAAELELREPILDLSVISYSLGPEDIAAGLVELPGQETDALYWEHREEYDALNALPEELALHATLVYEKNGEEITETRDLSPSAELGWSLRYWPRSEEASEWAFPGCFVFRTYESYTPISLVLNDPDGVNASTISASFTINGREIDPADIRYETLVDTYKVAGIAVSDPFQFARFIFPKPDWAPESGTIHVTVVQYLRGYRQVVVMERDVDYSEADDELS